ncbi:DUF4254 domain-containing protein [Nocardia donostiensis]|uniref:DUF4254 domain-containing protein n=1 Tax=Nocardia donostiensis TaxID=1538463 RepID=A0A1W0AZ61_9NOCA|nr:DUF4254 domain-containing protein [Nocardia donostiensis]ONM48894.1 hypothetical protein B0T46_10535 [Nocardia donostiensis]OQS15486.1 hypothetical protein B0T36_09505 [Nocardia donostiensis]OQS22850.1 hypothetical protein B0T44_03930 [Nocardia donostiensis]
MLTDPLPSKHQLLQACRGALRTNHPLLCHANELTTLHERRLCSPPGAQDLLTTIDTDRARLVRDIDRWVNSQLPPSPGSARLHTETVGAVVDRLAQLTAHAYAALTAPTADDLGTIWERLAELAVGYDDLAAELGSGRRRLPGGP